MYLQKMKQYQIDTAPSPDQDFVFFWKPDQPNGYLGNWFNAPFHANGIHFYTSEHYMMYHKALLMGDQEIANAIIQNPDPSTAKKLGSRVKPWNEEIWIRERCRIMYEACYAKFSAHLGLRNLLIATGDAVIAEASPLDKIWGIGIGVTNKDSANPQQWKGLNLLGKVLMKVREDLL